mmetsp:Transcript_112908/g.224737  ORF Transcript_112908/g.224737 Transcript_112908/m.224737 type:complete len:212 (-) Transcript_112908:52-687(-)
MLAKIVDNGSSKVLQALSGCNCPLFLMNRSCQASSNSANGAQSSSRVSKASASRAILASDPRKSRTSWNWDSSGFVMNFTSSGFRAAFTSATVTPLISISARRRRVEITRLWKSALRTPPQAAVCNLEKTWSIRGRSSSGITFNRMPNHKKLWMLEEPGTNVFLMGFHNRPFIHPRNEDASSSGASASFSAMGRVPCQNPKLSAFAINFCP